MKSTMTLDILRENKKKKKRTLNFSNFELVQAFVVGTKVLVRWDGGRGWAALPRVIYTQRQASVVPMGT